MPESDNDPAHSKLLKTSVEFFAGQVARLFRMGRCGESDCEGCTKSVLNLGIYFTRCLGRELGIAVEIKIFDKAPPETFEPLDGGLN